MCGHTHGPVIYSKFHPNPFRGFGAPGGQNLAFLITLAIRFYNSLYYRTSRDTLFPITENYGFKLLVGHLYYMIVIYIVAFDGGLYQMLL